MATLRLEPHEGDADLCVVECPNTPPATIRLAWMTQAGLSNTTEIDDDTCALIEQLRRQTDIWQAAVSLMAPRDIPRASVASKLVARGHAHQEVHTVLDALEHAGLLDDRRSAVRLVESRLDRAPEHPAKLIQRLEALGIDQDTAQEAVAQVLTNMDHDDLRSTAAHRAQRGLDRLPRDSAIRRFAGRLARQGWDEDDIATEVARRWPD